MNTCGIVIEGALLILPPAYRVAALPKSLLPEVLLPN